MMPAKGGTVMAANRDLSETQVNEFFTSLSNWGKWGQDDQLGALNYITPQKAIPGRSPHPGRTARVHVATPGDRTRS